MPRDLILGTAGHIDHGKTSLIKALTGIDCDRLPEEKQRGITIDIGFAHLELGEYRLGIVDVPGHERFIKNMLAGATGIDLALLVVAADDSVMPQTREHLEILKFLGIRHGLTALTKADLVDPTTLEVVTLEIRELLRGSFLADAPIVPCSAVTGAGLAELKEALRQVCGQVEEQRHQEWFRLPIDRAFVVQGHGTVVTGSVPSGSVRVGEELDWHRGDGTVERVRVRSLTNHGRPVEEVHRGQRAGINLAGVPHEAVRRGQELCTPGYLQPSRVLTVHLQAAASLSRPIRHRLPVHVHIGTAELMGTISLLDCDAVAPGQSALAQLFLETPATAVWGQPFVVRDAPAEQTLGGGRVLQPTALKIRRRHVEAILHLEDLLSPQPQRRIEAAAWLAGMHGVPPFDLIREAGVPPDQLTSLLDELQRDKRLAAWTLPPHRSVLLHEERVRETEQLILEELGRRHAAHPLLTSHDRQKLVAELHYWADEAILQAVIERLIQSGQLVGDARRIARADFKPQLTANQRKLKDRIVAAYQAGGFQPPEPKEFLAQAGSNATVLQDIYEVAVAEGFLVRITPELYLAAETEQELRRRVRQRLLEQPGLTVAEIRDLLQTTRKYAVPLCEYLDRIGLTVRQGDRRYLAASDAAAAAAATQLPPNPTATNEMS